MDNTTKRLVCRMVAGMVVTDDDFSDTERAFVDRMLHRFEIPASDWQAIFPLIDREEAATAMRSLAPDDQRQAFGLLLEAAMMATVSMPPGLVARKAVNGSMPAARTRTSASRAHAAIRIKIDRATCGSAR